MTSLGSDRLDMTFTDVVIEEKICIQINLNLLVKYDLNHEQDSRPYPEMFSEGAKHVYCNFIEFRSINNKLTNNPLLSAIIIFNIL